MNMKHGLMICACFCILSGSLTAQAGAGNEQKNLDNGTLSEQFDYVISKSNNYQKFKVIKKTSMATLKKHVLDSLEGFHSEIGELNADIKNKSDKIIALEGSLASVQTNLDTVTGEKDNINFMGMAMTKAKYKSTMWGIIGALGALFLFFLFKFKNSNSITKSTRLDLSALQSEFAAHKKSALVREQELARKLQDEINRVN